VTSYLTLNEFDLFGQNYPLHAERSVRGVIQLAGWKLWNSRREELLRHLGRFPFRHKRLLERHHIVLILPEIYKHLMLTGNLFAKHLLAPDQIASGMAMDAIGFSIGIMRLHQALSIQGRSRLKGAVTDALKRDFGFGSLRAESTVLYAMNLARCRVSAEDLEGRSNFDYLCELKGLEFEVECKFITEDIGSVPKQRDIDKFLIQFAPAPVMEAIGPKRTPIITLTCDDNLPADEKELASLADWIAHVASTGVAWARRKKFGLAIEEWGPGVKDPGSLYEKARELASAGVAHTMAYTRTDRGFIIGM
jgi:hypothetical protein